MEDGRVQASPSYSIKDQRLLETEQMLKYEHIQCVMCCPN